MDFLGNGRSDRVEEFPPALWIEWGRQAAALVRHLDMGKVSLVGTSGGRLVSSQCGAGMSGIGGKGGGGQL